MVYSIFLQSVHQYDRTVVGGKAYHLAQLAHAEFPVPPGFVILSTAYEQFVDHNHLRETIEQVIQHLSLDAPVEEASRTIRLLFEQATFPEELQQDILEAYRQLGMPAVAVRSSATAEDMFEASFAGLQDTFLNVSSEACLLDAIRRCWSSLWTARALIYRHRQGIAPEKNRMAVIVQQMVEAEASGVLFTRNPINSSPEEIVINAAWGLGEAIVSGHVTPDVIILEKKTGITKSAEIANKQVMSVPAETGVKEQKVPDELRQQPILSTQQITELYQLGTQIEQHFQIAQDIEWAISHHKLFVLQSRPITAFPTAQVVTVPQEQLPVPGDDSWDRQAELPVNPFDLWTRTNLGENFPDPITPLSATLWPTFFMMGRLPTKAERAPDATPLPSFGQRFYGRLYVNEGAVIHSAIEMGIPTAFLDMTWGSSGRGVRSSDSSFHFFRFLSRLPATIRISTQLARQSKEQKPPRQSSKKPPKLSGEKLFAQIDTWVDEFQQEDLSKLDDRALWERWVPSWIERGKSLRSILVNAQLAGLTFYLLERRLQKWTGKKGLAPKLVQALSGVFTAEVGSALWNMAQILRRLQLDEVVQQHAAEEALALLQAQSQATDFLIQFQALLERHGYRCANDAELFYPRWAERPEQVIELVKSYLLTTSTTNPVEIERRGQQEREQLTQQILLQLHPLRHALFRRLLRLTQNKIRQRDNGRSYVAKFLYPMRLLLAELGQRWAKRGWLATPDDIFFLTLYEIADIVTTENPSALAQELAARTRSRRLAFDYWHTIVAPQALGPGGIPLPDPEPMGSFLQGLPASPGRIRGKARLIKSLDETRRLCKEDILVTQATDPGWTPIFPLVSGLVLEVGGQLSHGAIIVRNYRVTTVINVPGAMQHIREGQQIEVDGTSGRVYLEIEE